MKFEELIQFIVMVLLFFSLNFFKAKKPERSSSATRRGGASPVPTRKTNASPPPLNLETLEKMGEVQTTQRPTKSKFVFTSPLVSQKRPSKIQTLVRTLPDKRSAFIFQTLVDRPKGLE